MPNTSPCQIDIWEEASGANRDALLSAVEDAAGALVARESPLPAPLVFTHALVRDAIYARQPLAVRQARHRRIAEALARRDGAAPGIVASHFALADDPRAIDWLVRAGEQALAFYAAQDALLAFNRAQEIAARFGQSLPAAAIRTRATAATLLGEFDQARRDHEQNLERGRATGDRHAEWQALVDLGLLWAERDYERTGAHYRGALALAREIGDDTLLAYSLNRVANWHVNLDEPDVGIPLHEEALALFTQTGDQAGIADTLDYLGMSSYLDSRFPRGAAYYEQAIALLRERGDRQRLATALAMLAATGGDVTWIASPSFREPGYWVHTGEEGLGIARDIGWSAGEAFARLCLSIVTVTRGDLGRALREAETALALARQVGHHQWMVGAQQCAAAAWIELLDTGRAISELEQALTGARISGSRFWTHTVIAMLASLYIAMGKLGHAAALLGNVAHSAHGRLSLSQRQCRFARAELLLAQDDPAAALAIVDELRDTRPDPSPDDRLPLLLKLRGDTLARLGRDKDAEQAYLAARDDASVLVYRPLLWRIEAALGRLYRAHGPAEQADAARARAQAIIDEMADTLDDAELRHRFRHRAAAYLPPAASTPARSPETLLSPRERDVLRHLVEGKSDREIAAALFISPRTVMRHVTGILTKLNVPSRTAAATLAVREGLA